MTITQEDALYDFLENATDSFTIDDVASFIRMVDSQGARRLGGEICSFINARNLAFRVDKKHLISRRGCFEPVPFVIHPSRTEIMNGILIPGHRCIPFANPALLPQEYTFLWKKDAVSYTTTEGPPEDFYPYYSLFGEEYAPQYVARDNPENESAFNGDPYEDPPEVSVHTLDMRNVYRASSFVPGDVFAVRTLDWKNGVFELERIPEGSWPKTELYDWFEAAEAGFRFAFEYKGPGSSTEEQIALAYWYGGKRMRELPAYALDDFLYNRTEQIETVPYGIETRFWYAGKEIPDQVHHYADQAPPDRTIVEEILFRHGIPVSEYVIQSYIRDALFRKEEDPAFILERIAPEPVITDLNRDEKKYLSRYIEEVFIEFSLSYSPFSERIMGPVRQRVAEMHTAVVELMARLKRSGINSAWFPKHTFVILSQIQGHAAGVLEDLDMDDIPEQAEIDAMENSLDSMLETYEDIRCLIEESTGSFRRSAISVVRHGDEFDWLSVQARLGGTDVWRRFLLPSSANLAALHEIIQAAFGWSGQYPHRFFEEEPRRDIAGPVPVNSIRADTVLGDLDVRGIMELIYEYGNNWNLRLLFLFRQEAGEQGHPCCIEGEGASPPETLSGPLRFRRLLSALPREGSPEQKQARTELGEDFDPSAFDLDACNAAIEIYLQNHSAKENN
ncbi:MAG: plasmid pRiA4b ORF-3 family protein [Spirochaetaceae bacterium]|nr:plasmid pRiA4b ORF-3 family protein [Spirochaetaceae bacterium]